MLLFPLVGEWVLVLEDEVYLLILIGGRGEREKSWDILHVSFGSGAGGGSVAERRHVGGRAAVPRDLRNARQSGRVNASTCQHVNSKSLPTGQQVDVNTPSSTSTSSACQHVNMIDMPIQCHQHANLGRQRYKKCQQVNSITTVDMTISSTRQYVNNIVNMPTRQ